MQAVFNQFSNVVLSLSLIPVLWQDKRRRYSMMRSNESASSVFYHSQEEEPGKSGSDGHGATRDISGAGMFDAYQSTMSESSPGTVEQDSIGNNLEL